MSSSTPDNPRSSRRKLILRIVGGTLGAAMAVALSWAIYVWATYPKVPDASQLAFNEALEYIGTDDFDRLMPWDKSAYVRVVQQRLESKTFEELIAILMNETPASRRIDDNLRKMPEYQQITGSLFQTFLTKFYEQSELKRTGYLSTLVLIEQGQKRINPGAFKLPGPDEFKREIRRFVSKQSPEVQARTGQFLIDLRKRRREMGFPDPF